MPDVVAPDQCSIFSAEDTHRSNLPSFLSYANRELVKPWRSDERSRLVSDINRSDPAFLPYARQFEHEVVRLGLEELRKQGWRGFLRYDDMYGVFLGAQIYVPGYDGPETYLQHLLDCFGLSKLRKKWFGKKSS